MIDIEDVRAAATRLAGVAHRTPVLRSRLLDEEVGAQVLCKAENLQRVGAFKFRGAYNALSALTDERGATGVFTYSSGNHAQAVALAAQLLGVPATILMPEDAPAGKLAATRGYGATVITYDRYRQDREALGRTLAEDLGLVLIPPYDHAHVMAGQGTSALELLDEVGELDALVVPVGGGGLLSGCATVAAALAPHTEVWGVEPAVRTTARDALAAGHPVQRPVPRTIADGQQTPNIGRLPFEVIAARATGVVGVEDDTLRRAMAFAFTRMKVVLEPSGAAALAAVLSGAVDVAGRRVGVILSGGNVDPGRFCELLG